MLGHKDEDDEKVPRVVESLLGRDIVTAACGVAHTMALGGRCCTQTTIPLTVVIPFQLQVKCIPGVLGFMVALDTVTYETDSLH